MEALVEPGVILLILNINASDGVWNDSLEELVPGDVIQIKVGYRAPADVRLCQLTTATLRSDEGALTR